MKKTILIALFVIALVAVGSASAKQKSWYLYHSGDSGQTRCDRGSQEGSIAGPFKTKAACEAYVIETPPVDVPPVDVPPVDQPPITEPPVVTPPVDETPVPEVPDTPSAVFLCYSHLLGSTPGMVEFDLIQLRVDQGWFAPIAVSEAEATKQHISTDKWAEPDGVHVLVCNPDGLKATGTGLNGAAGDFLDAAAWANTIIESQYDPQHRNSYEIFA